MFTFQYSTFRHGEIIEERKPYTVNGKVVKLNSATEARKIIDTWNRQGFGEWEHRIDAVERISA